MDRQAILERPTHSALKCGRTWRKRPSVPHGPVRVIAALDRAGLASSAVATRFAWGLARRNLMLLVR